VSAASIIIAGTVGSTAPLMFAGVGEYAAERAGTLNISVEAMMLAGAYVGIVVGSVSGIPALAVPSAMAAGLGVAFIHANLSHRLAANTFVVGLTLDVLVLGLTDFFFNLYPNSADSHFSTLRVPLLGSIPVIGQPLFQQPWPLYLLFGLVPLVWWLVQRTTWGLQLRASGENPEAADATGIHVNVRRRQGLYLCGLLSGLGGAFLSVGVVGSFNQDITDGIGFVVIAAVIFGGWTMRGTVLGCILFGFFVAMGQGGVLSVVGVHVNAELLLVLPYVVPLVAMLVLARSSRAPRALARPFVRGIS
jgi:ABC-type uncharacterized transport system permease subunit